MGKVRMYRAKAGTEWYMSIPPEIAAMAGAGTLEEHTRLIDGKICIHVDFLIDNNIGRAKVLRFIRIAEQVVRKRERRSGSR